MAEKLEEVKARRGRAAEGRNRQNLQKYCFINLFEQQQKALPRFALMLLAVEDSEVKTSHWWNLRKSNERNFNFQLQQWLGKRAWVSRNLLGKCKEMIQSDFRDTGAGSSENLFEVDSIKIRCEASGTDATFKRVKIQNTIGLHQK